MSHVSASHDVYSQHHLASSTDTRPKAFCYYSSFAQSRPGLGKFLPEDIDPDLCMHVIYAFGDISSNKLKASGWNDLGDAGKTASEKQNHC